jgi:hypothetical protein
MESLIGSFLLEEIVSHDSTKQYNCSHDDTVDASTAMPSLLLDVLSSYRDIRKDRYHRHRRILLEGSDLMTSSLLFDVALSLASETPCRCRYSNNHFPDGNSRMRSDSWPPLIGCEHCVAVTVIRSVARRDDPTTCPIMCQPAQSTSASSILSVHDNSLKSEDVSKKRRRDSCDVNRNRSAFRRVQIIYVSGIQDILHYLLTIASQPLTRQPLGGIFIDQLDEILMPPQQPDYQNDTATTTIRMSQVGTYFLFTPSPDFIFLCL